MKSQLDFPIEIKGGFRYLHIREVVERGPDLVRVRCSRNRLHSFYREDFKDDGAWNQINKGACLSVRITDWKLSEINVIGSG
jgi:hypothetical protein